jgi:hypothetical protein
MHGFRDFFLHLFTITVGLLIALSLEGCVERHHQRYLVSEAEAGLRTEIAQNSKALGTLRQQIKERRKELDGDLATLTQMRVHPAAEHHSLSFTFGMHKFDNVAWKTAQTTGALAYMPYGDARTFSDIYDTQDELYKTEVDVVEDVMHSASFASTQPDDWKPTPAQADELTDRIGMLRMRLLLLSSLVDALDKTYQKFESGHS